MISIQNSYDVYRVPIRCEVYVLLFNCKTYVFSNFFKTLQKRTYMNRKKMNYLSINKTLQLLGLLQDQCKSKVSITVVVFKHMNSAVAQWVRALSLQAEGRMVEFQPRQT